MMKNLFKPVSALLLFSALFSLITFTSCDKDDEAKRYLINVKVSYPEGYSDSQASGIEVKAVNSQTGTETKATSDANGIAQFTLVSGIYSFSVAQETEEFAFNGLLENATVSQDAALTLELHATSLTGGLVFKEFYYSGSRTEAGGTYYSDQCVEIYNNSDEVIYLDNLGYGSLDPTGSSSPSVWVDDDGNLPDRIPLFSYCFYIKGSGTDHPLQPRTGIVIAQDGIDHRSDPLGNSLSPVNLGNADWELYVGDVNGGKDADAAGVPNMTLLYTTTTSMFDALYSVGGPAVIIFQFPEGVDPAEFAADEANLSTKPGTSSATKYLMIPKSYVVDALECVSEDESKRYKRIPSDLDAGYTFISEGTYSGKSVRRKVKQIIDGKVIYKDTNNSSEDFLRDQVPTIFSHPTAVDN